MMRLNKKGVILIYVLVLINVALIMALVTFNNTNILSENSSYQNIERELYQKISSKGKYYINYQLSLNKDGSGFVDNISCPNSVTMSGNTSMVSGITSILTYSGASFFCSGSYNTLPFNIFFNNTFTSFVGASYNGLTVGLVSNGGGLEGSSRFLDADQTLLSFQNSSYQIPDSIDDNFDSDSYTSYSTGIITYPNSYKDNDDLGRKEIFGYITSTGVYENVFWNNFETNEFISANPNNTGTLNKNIGLTASGSFFLDIDKNFSLKVVRFDRSLYTKFSREIVPLETFTGGGLSAGSGYIQNIGGVLSLTSGITSNTTFLNFRDNDYAIFISNDTESGPLHYKIIGKNPILKDMYINPIDDSYPDKIKYLGNYIITNPGNIYIGKQFEIMGLK